MSFLGLLESKMLKESASIENVMRAMDNHSKVIINYHTEGGNKNTGSRIIEPVAYGLTTAGNPVIRAYQPYGDTTTKTPGWKFFRLDRISYWEETGVKFGEIPDFNMDELNKDGDKTMAVVIKTYNSTTQNDTSSYVNNGPKTKEKLLMQTQGDNALNLGKRNLELMKNGIKIDLDNNRKSNNSFNMYTNKTQTTPKSGPRLPDQSYKPQPQPQNISGSSEKGDINPIELQKNREKVYNFNDYSHQLDKNDYTDSLKQQQRDKYNQKRRDNRWQKSTDNMFKNRKDSDNRELYNMKKDIDVNDENSENLDF